MSELEASLIQPGWEVYSSDGQRVGRVRQVESEQVEMELEILGGSSVSIPFGSITSADDGRLELDVPAEEVGLMGWEQAPGA